MATDNSDEAILKRVGAFIDARKRLTGYGLDDTVAAAASDPTDPKPMKELKMADLDRLWEMAWNYENLRR